MKSTKSKKYKTHFYSDENPTDEDGYGKTACGKSGKIVGGLIAYFFKTSDKKSRCKTCNKIFKNKII